MLRMPKATVQTAISYQNGSVKGDCFVKAYHRIVGDWPQVGFTVASVGSTDFPANNWAKRLEMARLPVLAPYPQNIVADGLEEQQHIYEIQPSTYGGVIVVSSAKGRSADHLGRTHSYTHLTALVNVQQANNTSGSPRDWLRYHEFLSLKDFWRYNPSLTTKNTTEWFIGCPTDWSPEQSPAIAAWTQPFSKELSEALLFYYWRTASDRAFAPENEQMQPIEVCLGEERDRYQLIAQGKSFLADCILAHLPFDAQWLASMSVPVQQSSEGLFDRTALVILFPEATIEHNRRLFDLRATGKHPSLAAVESEFIQSIQRGERSEWLNMVCKSAGTEAATEPIAFLADFRIVYSLYCLQNQPLSSTAFIDLWSRLSTAFQMRHGFTQSQTDDLLLDVETELLQKLNQQPDQALSANCFAFLLNKALRTSNEKLYAFIMPLLVNHLKRHDLPYVGETLLQAECNQHPSENRLCQTLSRLLFEGYIEPPLEQAQLDALLKPEFTQRCKASEALQKTMASFCNAFVAANPQANLFLLPLAILYLNQEDLLKHTLLLLHSSYIHTLPDERQCRDIRNAAAALNPENAELLLQYQMACFTAHQEEPESVYAVIRTMGQDTTGFLCSVLALDEHAQQMEPFTPSQINLLLQQLYPQVQNPQAVRNALLGYVKRALQVSITSHQDNLLWFNELDLDERILQKADRIKIGILYFCVAYQEGTSLPNADSFQLILRWCAVVARNAFIADYEQPLKQLYERLGNIGREQLIDLLPFFSNVTDTPYVNSVFLSCMQYQLRNRWRKEAFFQAIITERPQWAKGALTPQQLLDDETMRCAMQKMRASMDQFTKVADYEQCSQQILHYSPQDAFYVLAQNAYRDSLVSRCELILSNCATANEARRMQQLLVHQNHLTAGISQTAQLYLQVFTELDCFFSNELRRLTDDELIPKIQQHIAKLQSCPDCTICTAMLHWLHDLFFASHQLYSLRQRIAGIMLLCARPKHQLDCNAFFHYLKASDVNAQKLLDQLQHPPKQPFDDKSIQCVAYLGLLFRMLEQCDAAFPAMLLQVLMQPNCKQYTAHVRKAAQKSTNLLPWLRHADIAHVTNPTPAYQNWLTNPK